jgi:PhnB protein
MQISPYLFFEGRCEEAIEFYKQAVGAQVQMMMRFNESPDPQPGSIPPGAEDKVMHASIKIGETVVMCSDGHCTTKGEFKGFRLALTVPDVAAAEKTFAALSAGGSVQMPLMQTFFSPKFGMLSDKFGVSWMLMVRT